MWTAENDDKTQRMDDKVSVFKQKRICMDEALKPRKGLGQELKTQTSFIYLFIQISIYLFIYLFIYLEVVEGW